MEYVLSIGSLKNIKLQGGAVCSRNIRSWNAVPEWQAGSGGSEAENWR
jgi:hypothetical protein